MTNLFLLPNKFANNFLGILVVATFCLVFKLTASAESFEYDYFSPTLSPGWDEPNYDYYLDTSTESWVEPTYDYYYHIEMSDWSNPSPEPSYPPLPEPSVEPTPEPSYPPVPEPTFEPTPEPSHPPLPEPTFEPTPEPSYPPEYPEFVPNSEPPMPCEDAEKPTSPVSDEIFPESCGSWMITSESWNDGTLTINRIADDNGEEDGTSTDDGVSTSVVNFYCVEDKWVYSDSVHTFNLSTTTSILSSVPPVPPQPWPVEEDLEEIPEPLAPDVPDAGIPEGLNPKKLKQCTAVWSHRIDAGYETISGNWMKEIKTDSVWGPGNWLEWVHTIHGTYYDNRNDELGYRRYTNEINSAKNRYLDSGQLVSRLVYLDSTDSTTKNNQVIKDKKINVTEDRLHYPSGKLQWQVGDYRIYSKDFGQEQERQASWQADYRVTGVIAKFAAYYNNLSFNLGFNEQGVLEKASLNENPLAVPLDAASQTHISNILQSVHLLAQYLGLGTVNMPN